MTVHSKSSRSACACSARCSRVFFRFHLPGESKNADFHPVHWEISSFCSFRHARHLLPEKCQLSEWKPRSPGAARDRSHHRPPSLETPDAFLNLRRVDLLCCCFGLYSEIPLDYGQRIFASRPCSSADRA